MATTMKQIAQALGISRTTVSLVLQGRGDEYRISPETQALIQSYVDKSDFKPNYFAQALNRKKTGVIGVVFPDVFESFMSKMIRGIESALYPQGYTLSVSTTQFDQSREKAILETMVWQRVDGIIWAPTVGYRSESKAECPTLSVFQSASLPVVLVDRSVPTGFSKNQIQKDSQKKAHSPRVSLKKSLGFPGVYQQDYSLTYQKVREVMASHSKTSGTLVCVSFDLEASSLIDRLRGAEAAAQDLNWGYYPILLQEQNPHATDLEQALHLLTKKISSSPLVFFTTTAGLAEKLHWLIHSSISKPDLSRAPIIRFGDSSPWMTSPFQEIAQPHEAMGMVAGLYLHKLILKEEHLPLSAGQENHKDSTKQAIGLSPEQKVIIETCWASYPEAKDRIWLSE